MKDSVTGFLQPRLDELGSALRSCRTICEVLRTQKCYEPSKQDPSVAQADFQMTMTGPAGIWPSHANGWPRSTAVKLLQQQADYCFALGLLAATSEIRDPAATLVRSIVEYGTRGFWILDPTVNHRSRCARTVLLELVSAYLLREAIGKMPPSPEVEIEKAKAKSASAEWKRRATDMFDPVRIVDDHTRWSIEDQVYDNWTSIAAAWSTANQAGVDGSALYKTLAVSAHPQGHSATYGLVVGAHGQGFRYFSMEWMETIIQLAIVSFHSAVMHLTRYLGHCPRELAEWESYIEKVLPNNIRRTGSEPN